MTAPAPAQSLRLFFAVWPPEPVAQALASNARALARHFGGRPTRPETVHLTLAFLGEVPAADLPAVQEAARGVKAAAFGLTIDRLGFWRHNRLIWAGCTSTPPELQSIADGLRNGLRAASLPCDASQPFAPHLTLVRKVRDARPFLPDPEPLSWFCERFVLVRSAPTQDGAAYAIEAAYPLSTGTT